MILLSTIDVHTTKVQLALFMVVLGAGMGFLMQTTMLIAQNSVEQKDLGVASSAATFFRSIGGSFGVSLFGTIFVRTLNSDLAGVVRPGRGQVHRRRRSGRPGHAAGAARRGPAAAASTPSPTACRTVFLWAIPFAALVAVLALFIKEVTLRGGPATPADAAEGEQAPSALVGAME